MYCEAWPNKLPAGYAPLTPPTTAITATAVTATSFIVDARAFAAPRGSCEGEERGMRGEGAPGCRGARESWKTRVLLSGPIYKLIKLH